MKETEELTPGSLFSGKYRIERLVGKGGMSAVYEATNLMLQSRVALKVMSDELSAIPEAVERFIREGIATSRVRHRAIVQVYDAGEHKGTPWIAMEFLEGEALNERFERTGPLAPDEVIRIAKEIAGGLAAAHDQGVIHRDLKPHNIVLDESSDPPQPKILDFGIAKLGDAGMAKLTQTGIMMGTPHYMSPEQAQGAPDIGIAVDFWALGVIMLEAISGHMPYAAESVAAYLGQLVTAKPRSVHELAPSTPEPLRRVIAWCLETDPNDRPSNAKELIAELDKVAGEIATGEAPKGPPIAKSIRPTERSVIIEPLVEAEAPAPPASSQPPGDSLPPAGQDSQDGSLTGKPGVVPIGAEVTDTIIAVPTKPPPAPRERRGGRWLLVLAVLVLGTAGAVVAGVLMYQTFRPEEAPAPPRPVPDAAPAVAKTTPQIPQQPTKREPPEKQSDALVLRPGSVLIDSAPRGAEVLLNGFDLGKRTPLSLPLTKAAHIEVRLDGYVPSSKIFQPGQPSLLFRLEKASSRR